MTARVAINGFGRIGRLTLRTMLERHKQELSVVAINDMADLETNAHLFRYDSTYGIFPGKVEIGEGVRRVESIYSRRAEEPKVACQRKPTASLAPSSTERLHKKPFACLPTALRPSGPVQQWIFHQAEQELTTLPRLRYSSGHRKGRLKILSIRCNVLETQRTWLRNATKVRCLLIAARRATESGLIRANSRRSRKPWHVITQRSSRQSISWRVRTSLRDRKRAR